MDAEHYKAQTVEDLRKLASGRGIPGRSEMNKGELVEALTDDDNTPRASAGQVLAVQQSVADIQQQIEVLRGRVTQLELQASGAIRANPIAQRR
jgi:hypothetical protein